jgi:hypothetical protein
MEEKLSELKASHVNDLDDRSFLRDQNKVDQNKEVAKHFKHLEAEYTEAIRRKDVEDDPGVQVNLSRRMWASTEVKERAPNIRQSIKEIGTRKRATKISGSAQGDVEAGMAAGPISDQAIPLQPVGPESIPHPVA